MNAMNLVSLEVQTREQTERRVSSRRQTDQGSAKLRPVMNVARRRLIDAKAKLKRLQQKVPAVDA
jgi:hypothetical protein